MGRKRNDNFIPKVFENAVLDLLREKKKEKPKKKRSKKKRLVSKTEENDGEVERVQLPRVELDNNETPTGTPPLPPQVPAEQGGGPVGDTPQISEENGMDVEVPEGETEASPPKPFSFENLEGQRTNEEGPPPVVVEGGTEGSTEENRMDVDEPPKGTTNEERMDVDKPGEGGTPEEGTEEKVDEEKMDVDKPGEEQTGTSPQQPNTEEKIDEEKMDVDKPSTDGGEGSSNGDGGEGSPSTEGGGTKMTFSIDPAFLAALPDDIRTEVILQQLPSLIHTSTSNNDSGSTIHPDFLNALPTNIQQEVMQQEQNLLQSQQRLMQNYQQINTSIDNIVQSVQQSMPTQPQNTTTQPTEDTATTSTTEGEQPQTPTQETTTTEPTTPTTEQIATPTEGEPTQPQPQPPQPVTESSTQPENVTTPTTQPQPQEGEDQTTTTTTTTGTGGTTQPPPLTTGTNEQYDAATFIQTLPPHLRQEVLLGAEESVLNTLPPELVAEAYSLRNRNYNFGSGLGGGRNLFGGRQGSGLGRVLRKKPKSHPFLDTKDRQGECLLGESDIQSLLRLTYVSKFISKTTLQKILLISCKFGKCRTTLFQYLFGIIVYNIDKEVLGEITPPELIKGSVCGRPSQASISLAPPQGKESDEAPVIPSTIMNRAIELMYLLSKTNTLFLSKFLSPPSSSEGDNKVVKTDEDVKMISDGDVEKLPLYLILKLFDYYSPGKNLESGGTVSFLKLIIKLSDIIYKYVLKKREHLEALEKKPKVKKVVMKEEEEEGETKEEDKKKEGEKKEEKKKEKTKEEEKVVIPELEDLRKRVIPLTTDDMIIEKIMGVLIDFESSSIEKYCIRVLDSIGKLNKTKLKNILRQLAMIITKLARKKTFFVEKGSSVEPKAVLKNQAKFSKLIKSYSNIYTKKLKEKEIGEDVLQNYLFFSQTSFDFIWKRLGQQLDTINFQVLDNKQNNLIPLIEAFFKFHQIFIKGEANGLETPTPTPGGGLDGAPTPVTSTPNELKLSKMQFKIHTPIKSNLERKIEMFFEKYRAPLNNLIKINPSLLTSSLNLLLQYPKYLSFENKRIYFREQLKREQKLTGFHSHRSLRIRVRRTHIFDDTYHQIKKLPGHQLKRKLNITFEGEAGVDTGGLTREFFLLLSQTMIKADYGLFTPSADRTTYQPNPISNLIDNREHLQLFSFISKIIAMAIYNEKLIDCYFTRSFYKHILGKKISFSDIESIDVNYYKNLKWILDNDITEVLDLTFTTEIDKLGKLESIDLVPNGKNIKVTNDNKLEYVHLLTEFKMTKLIEKQLQAFLKGFYEIIPRKLISIFNDQELELLMNGLTEFDVDDLRDNTNYHGYASNNKVILFFWNWVETLTRDEKALFLQFVTGTSKIPLGGFSNLLGASGVQKFNIHKVPGNTARLPTAHTCFNQLDLPEYETEAILKERMYYAIREGSVGFGFV